MWPTPFIKGTRLSRHFTFWKRHKRAAQNRATGQPGPSLCERGVKVPGCWTIGGCLDWGGEQGWRGALLERGAGGLGNGSNKEEPGSQERHQADGDGPEAVHTSECLRIAITACQAAPGSSRAERSGGVVSWPRAPDKHQGACAQHICLCMCHACLRACQLGAEHTSVLIPAHLSPGLRSHATSRPARDGGRLAAQHDLTGDPATQEVAGTGRRLVSWMGRIR